VEQKSLFKDGVSLLLKILTINLDADLDLLQTTQLLTLKFSLTTE